MDADHTNSLDKPGRHSGLYKTHPVRSLSALACAWRSQWSHNYAIRAFQVL